MTTSPFQGPITRNLTTNPVGGFLPPARGLNAYMTAQASYLASGAVPTSATSANPPVVTQPALLLVINTGTSVSYGLVHATTVTLPSGSIPQDVYCDVTLAGVFTTQHGAPGFTPTPPASNALRIWKVTTGAGNVGVVLPFTDLANRSPFNPPLSSVMAIDGHNAGAVALPSSLSIPGQMGCSGGLSLKGSLVSAPNTNSIQMITGAAAVSQGFPPVVSVSYTGCNALRGKLTFSISSMSFVTGVTLYIYLTDPTRYLFGSKAGYALAQDAATAALNPILNPQGGNNLIEIQLGRYFYMVAGTTYRLCYKVMHS